MISCLDRSKCATVGEKELIMGLRRNRLSASLLAVVLAGSPLTHAASRTAATSRRSRAPQVLSPTSRRHSSSNRAKHRRNARRSKPNAYQRLAKMQMDPSRVDSIQKALSGAGVYHGVPTGQWDSKTRDAMARYQAQNGFGVTGLPDAKSLMKLGLGPHPLPPELDKTRVANLQPNAAVPNPGDPQISRDASSAPNPAPAAASQGPPQR
jgi:hypothetical protein